MLACSGFPFFSFFVEGYNKLEVHEYVCAVLFPSFYSAHEFSNHRNYSLGHDVYADLVRANKKAVTTPIT